MAPLRLVRLVTVFIAAGADIILPPWATSELPALPMLFSEDESHGRMLQANIAGDTNGLTVMTPAQVKGDYMHSEALFGTPPYGGNKRIVGQLVYATPGRDQDGCGGYERPKAADSSAPQIFLVDAPSNCAFAEVARQAQSRGAAAVIVADSRCLCSDSQSGVHPEAFAKECKEAFNLVQPPQCTRSLPFMADDGSGADVSIPSLMVSLWDGRRLKDCYQTSSGVAETPTASGVTCSAQTPIMVSLAWEMPNPDDNVEWELWSNSDADATFKTKFATTALALESSSTFSPHYFIWDGERWGCTGDDQRCTTQCTHDGRYCNPDPDRNLNEGVSGADIVRENLRQLCVWRQANESAAASLWWQYATAFSEDCHGGEATADTFNEACSKRVHDSIEGLSWEETLRCIRDTDRADGANELLESELLRRTDKGILVLPTVVVNNVVLRGAITPSSVLQTICSGYQVATEPELCHCTENTASLGSAPDCALTQANRECGAKVPGGVYCSYTLSCTANEDECNSNLREALGDSGGMSVGGIVGIALAAVTALGVVGLVYWRREKSKVQREVREILQQYMPLEEIPPSRSATNGDAPSAMPQPAPGKGDNADILAQI